MRILPIDARPAPFNWNIGLSTPGASSYELIEQNTGRGSGWGLCAAALHHEAPRHDRSRGITMSASTPWQASNARQCRKKATMQPNFLHTVAGETTRVGVRHRYVRVTCVHTPLRATRAQ